MPSRDHQRLEEVFAEALQCSGEADRTAFLMRACGDDDGLRSRVEGLLSAHQQAGSFLDSPVIDPQATVIAGDAQRELAADSRVGPYRILQVLGEGGFGVVYLASQEEPVRRQVALKVIKLGMDTRQVIARFEAERQALAMMDHPNIARVFDAGTTPDGRPYFVMELVRGIALTDYCNRSRLTLSQRLELLLPVCHAVQHAHQKGIIHRDLKPRNVLVTMLDNQPVPKVIDFGIAKATTQPLTERPAYTELRQFLGTPEYMSPDQAENDGLDVDTRTDVYSLGVMLYELLTGTTPLDAQTLRKAGLEEIRRVLREVEPMRPSLRLRQQLAADSGLATRMGGTATTLPRAIRGDLDWVTMRALEKDRSRRYQTARELARDLQRYLNHEPVNAGPPGAAYRLSKFVRRNRFAVLAGSLVGSALVVGLALALIGWSQAASARDDLKAERDTARQARGQAEFARRAEAEQRRQAEAHARRAESVNDFLREILSSVDPSQARGREVSMRYVLDEAARRISAGALSGQPDVEADVRTTIGQTFEALGAYQAAESQLRAAVNLLIESAGPERAETLRCRSSLASVLNNEFRFGDAEEILGALLPIQARVAGEDNLDTLSSRSRLGTALAGQAKLAQAERVHQQNVQTQRRVLGADHFETLRSEISLAAVYRAEGRNDEAEPLLRDVLERARRALGSEHPEVMRALTTLAQVLESRGKFAAAEELYRESWELDQRVLGAEHPRTLLAMNDLLRILQTQRKTKEMRPLVQLRLERLRRQCEPLDASAEALNAYAWELLTCEPTDLRDPTVATRAAERAVQQSGGRDAGLLQTLAIACRAGGDLSRAIETQRRAVEAARAGGPYNRREMEELLVEMLIADGRMVEAASFQLAGLASQLGQSVAAEYSGVGSSLRSQAETLIERGDWPSAEQPLRACLVLRQKELPPEHWAIAEARSLLGSVLTHLARYSEAEPLLRDALAALEADPRAPARVLEETRARLDELKQARKGPTAAAVADSQPAPEPGNASPDTQPAAEVEAPGG